MEPPACLCHGADYVSCISMGGRGNRTAAHGSAKRYGCDVISFSHAAIIKRERQGYVTTKRTRKLRFLEQKWKNSVRGFVRA